MAFRNLMLNVKMQIDHFEIIGEVQIGGAPKSNMPLNFILW